MITRTYATLEVSQAAYNEISKKLREAGYDHAFDVGADQRSLMDMDGIALVARPETEMNRIPLPNLLWLRSDLQPQYAVVLDPKDQFFGWKMIENPAYKTWTSVASLTDAEVIKAEEKPAFSAHSPQLAQLRKMRGIGEFAAATANFPVDRSRT